MSDAGSTDAGSTDAGSTDAGSSDAGSTDAGTNLAGDEPTGPADPGTFGRVGEDGTVFVRTAGGERAVGSWLAGPPEAGLAHFARKYDELATEVALLEQRIQAGTGDAKAARERVRTLAREIPEANAVGDLDGLLARVNALLELAQQRVAREEVLRVERAAEAVEVKRALAEEAENLVTSQDWKVTSARYREILTGWKSVRIDRRTDSELLHRVHKARDAFAARRTEHFAALEEQRKTSAERKERLTAEAESLASSTDWAATANRLKALMAEWKKAGRAAREVDDALWTRFRAAQDAFFTARSASLAARDEELRGNAEAKERLAAEAEAIDVPALGLDQAKARLRDIQTRWDKAGRAPREVAAALEQRLKAVEDRVRAASEAHWRRAEVATSPLVIRLRESVEKLEKRIARATENGDDTTRREAEEALATQRQWLSQAEDGTPASGESAG